MPKANINKIILVLVSLVLLGFSGCGDPKAKKAQSLNEIEQLRATGDNTTALAKLESLSRTYPDDSEILQQIGRVHQTLGNAVESAFYLGAAYALAPDDLELLYQNYRAQENAKQSTTAYELLKKLAADKPAAMTGELWLRLGELHAQAQKTQAALDAYLKGITSENETLATETVVAIGTLFKQLDNLPQAERWFLMAANSNEPNALRALFGLLEIYLRNENWVAAEKSISQLDRQFPGAVDASEWADVRSKLQNWREAQADMQGKLAELADTKTVGQQTNPTAANTAEMPAAPSGKAQIITDIENAEALANTPAREMAPADKTEQPEANVRSITPDPNIAIEPAEPEPDLSMIVAGQNIEYPSGITIGADATTTLPSPANQSMRLPRKLADLLTEAETATSGGNYEKAIRLYWEALGMANNRADLWNTLSNVYLIDGQAKNAATTALEATRLDPVKVEYVLDYLRIIQRTKKPVDFIAELETAYDRFPRSPEITLSLARAYRRVDGNIHAAKILYKRFIELAPNHPLRPEAEAALAQIR